MKNLNFLKLLVFCGIFSILLSNCKSTPESAKLKPEKVVVSGDLGKYFEIVDNEYELTKEYSTASIAIKIKAKEKLPETIKLFSDGIHNPNFDLQLTILDEKGMPISGIQDLILSSDSREKFKSLLATGSGEEFITLSNSISDYNPEKHAEIVKKFAISSVLTETKQTENSSKILKQEDFKIYNNVKSYFKVVEGEYKPYTKNGFVYVEVSFELLKTYTQSVAHEQAFIELIPKNKNGGKVKNQAFINFRPSGNSDGAAFYNFLKAAPGEKITFEFSAGTAKSDINGDVTEAQELVADLAKFDVKVEFN